MNKQSDSIVARILKYAAVFALAAYLVRFGVCQLVNIWWILFIIAIVVIAIVIGWRVWRSRQW